MNETSVFIHLRMRIEPSMRAKHLIGNLASLTYQPNL